MARKSISREQADLIVNRLLSEPLWASPSQAELAADIAADDDAAVELLFRHAPDIMPELGPEDGQRILHTLERLVDKVAIREGHRATECADLRARLHEIRAATAALGEARAKLAGRVAAAAAAKVEVDLIVERQVTRRLTAAAFGPAAPAPAVVLSLPPPAPEEPAPGKLAVPPLSKTGSRKTLLSALVEPWFVARRQRNQATHQVIGQEKGTIRRFLEVCGDRMPSAYDRGDITEFLDKLRRLPATYGKSPKDHEISVDELAAQANEKERKTKTKVARLADKTAQRHLSALSKFLQYAVDKGHLSVTAHVDLLGKHSFRAKNSAREQRDAWEPEELIKLFSSPVWTGCHPHFRTQPGAEIIRDSKFWLPLLAAYHGGRLEEYADLYGRDVICDGGTWAVNLVESADAAGERSRRLKNKGAKRTVALHPEILLMGFVAYVRRTAPRPDDPLFPDIRPQGKDGKRGPRITRWFVEYRKAIEVYREGVAMHAFRHSANTRLRDVITDRRQERHINYIFGHSTGGGEGAERYDKGPGLREAAATLALLKYAELDLSHLYVADGDAA